MREFLRGLELDDETIDTIMAEVGKGYTKLKEEVEDYKTKVSDYESQIKELNEKVEADSKSLENLQLITNENKDLKADIVLNGNNVKKEFSKFVRNEVYSKVNDDVDFETALNDYKKENPQYFGETIVKKVQTSPTLNGGVPQAQTTNNIMNDILRGAAKTNE